MIIVYSKIEKRAAQREFNRLKKWFEENPKRRICRTEFSKIRRAHMKEDFLKLCVDGTVLK